MCRLFSNLKSSRLRGDGIGIAARMSQKSASQGVTARWAFMQIVELTTPKLGRDSA